MGLPVRDLAHHTYGDYLHWDDDRQFALIDGIAHTMVPAPLRIHQEVVGGIYRQAANALEGARSRVLIAPLDVRLPKSGEADDQVDTVLQPDVLAVCDPRKLDERGVRSTAWKTANTASRTSWSWRERRPWGRSRT